jgi:AcrR family transcriptional regulator
MSEKDGRGGARQELRAALIKTASRIIAEEGAKGLKARDLAKEVGCALGSIYNVFPDMDALVLAIRIETLDRLETEVIARVGDDTPDNAKAAGERLMHLTEVYIDFAHANWGLWSAAFEHTDVAGEAWDAYLGRLAHIFERIEAPLRALGQNMPVDRLSLLSRALFSAVHGIVLNGLDQSLGSVSLEDVKWQARTVLSAALAGLATQSRV